MVVDSAKGTSPTEEVPPRRRLRFRRLSPWLAVDSLLWCVMYLGSLWQRFDFDTNRTLNALEGSTFLALLLGTTILAGLLGIASGIYRGRFVPGSLLEVAWVAITLGSAALIVFFVVIWLGPSELPRGLPLVGGAFTLLAALILRSLARGNELFGAGTRRGDERVIVFGAGSGGRQLVKQLRQSTVSSYDPVAILDDDTSKRDMLVEVVRVRGTRQDLETIAKKLDVGTLIIAAPSLPREDLIAIRDRAESVGMHVLVLPALDQLMTSRRAVDELRQINVEDLLGRKPARLNQTQIAESLRAKKVLVTGAGGSIGSELCRQLIRFRPAELIMLDRDESGLHAVQLSIQKQSMLDGDDTVLASIRDRDSLEAIFAQRRPDVVFHAAALKHMPLLEKYPVEAVKTNVIGTANLLAVAKKFGVSTFVNISTDKAANASNILGFSKRVAEKLTAGAAVSDPGCRYVSVRFGNVLGSRGSVLTVFEKQIGEGGPVTVTDRNVSRFFMTIPEACQLVLQAAAVGESGKTLVLDMGEPIRIADVARTLIEQSGKDIEIVYTGLRNNEKLTEELFDDSEQTAAAAGHAALSAVQVNPLAIDDEQLTKLGTASVDDSRQWLIEKGSH